MPIWRYTGHGNTLIRHLTLARQWMIFYHAYFKISSWWLIGYNLFLHMMLLSSSRLIWEVPNCSFFCGRRHAAIIHFVSSMIFCTFFPSGIQNFRSYQSSMLWFFLSLGHRLFLVSNDPGETFFLFQRLSVAFQRFNSVCFCHSFGSLPAQFFDHRDTRRVLQFALISSPLGIQTENNNNNNNNDTRFVGLTGFYGSFILLAEYDIKILFLFISSCVIRRPLPTWRRSSYERWLQSMSADHVA